MILIDTREPKALRDALSMNCEAAKIETKAEALKYGDYWLMFPDGRLTIIERKTGSDLASSIADSRLFKQFEGMLSMGPDQLIYLIEGLPLIPAPKGISTRRVGVHPNAVRGALLSLQSSACVVHSLNADDTVTAILWLYRKGMSVLRKKA